MKRKLSKTELKRARKAAHKLPNWAVDIAASKAVGKPCKGRLGTFGAASEVRSVDPKSIKVEDYFKD